MMTNLLTFLLNAWLKKQQVFGQVAAVRQVEKNGVYAGKRWDMKPFAVYMAGLCICSIHHLALAAETLEQAWDIALKRDHVLGAMQQKELAANHQLQAAQANYLPKLAMELGYTRLASEPAAKLSIPALPMLKGVNLPFAQDAAYLGAVTLNAPLYTSGKISAGVAAAQAQSLASEAKTQSTRSDLKLAIAQSYIAVLRAEHAVLVSQSHVEAVSKHVADVQALFDKGYASRNDVLATQVTLANAQQLQLQAGNALELSKAAFNRWLGRDYEQAVTIVDIGAGVKPERVALPELAGLLQTAKSSRQELKELAQQGLAYKKQAASVAAGHLPQIGFNAGYGKLENRYLAEDKGWWVGVVMKWDLFDGGLSRHQASQLSATSQAISEMESDTSEKIALQVRQAWLSQKEAAARMQVLDKSVEQAEESLTLARERYLSGLAPNSEVLDAETRRLQAHSNRDNAKYDHAFARLQLQHAAGQL